MHLSDPKPDNFTLYLGRKAHAFWLVHLTAIVGVATLGFSWTGLGIALAAYAFGMFFVTAAYHRYFSHRAFKTSRPVQFLFAWFAQGSAQKGALWWAAHHRRHHKYSDTDKDLHSPVVEGFWYSHVGWILDDRTTATDWAAIGDFAKFPELRFLNSKIGRYIPPITHGILAYLIGGAFGVLWAFFVPTVLLWHGTFTINSLSHVYGSRRYATSDDSRNNPLLALITLGEGWHNNHHHYQSSVRQGFYWWEVDITYYVLRAMAAVGLVWDLRMPPERVFQEAQKNAPRMVAATAGPKASVAAVANAASTVVAHAAQTVAANAAHAVAAAGHAVTAAGNAASNAASNAVTAAGKIVPSRGPSSTA